MSSIAESWNRIERWAHEHLPGLLLTLQPPATIERIRAVEARIGVRLHEDVVASYLVHDGQDYNPETGRMDGPALFAAPAAPHSFMLLTLDRVVEETLEAPCEEDEDEDKKRARRGGAVIGYSDGDKLYAAPGGRLVTVPHDEEGAPAVAPSLGAWLERFADDLEAGFYSAKPGRATFHYRCAAPVFPSNAPPPPEAPPLPPFSVRFPDVHEATSQGDEQTFEDLDEALRAGDGARTLLLRYCTELPPEIGTLRRLRTLQIVQSPLEALPPELGYLTDLEWLTLGGTKVRHLPRSLARLGQERPFHLTLEESPIEVFPEAILGMHRLVSLIIYRCRLTSVPRGLSLLRDLEKLDLGWNGLTGLPDDLRELPRLKKIDMSYNPVRDFTALEAALAPIRIVHT